MRKEPRYIDIKKDGDFYAVREVCIPRSYNNTLKRIPYDSIVAGHVENCVQRANNISQPEKRGEFLEGELEIILG
jgi:hypothetical protein